MKRIFEINGITVEADDANLKRVDTFKVGDAVKVLSREYSGGKILSGTIVDFINFRELPTIVVAVFESTWNSHEIKFININKETEAYEIVPASPHELQLDKERVVDKMNAEIESLKSKIDSIEAHKQWFLKYYGQYFETFEVVGGDLTT